MWKHVAESTCKRTSEQDWHQRLCWKHQVLSSSYSLKRVVSKWGQNPPIPGGSQGSRPSYRHHPTLRYVGEQAGGRRWEYVGKFTLSLPLWLSFWSQVGDIYQNHWWRLQGVGAYRRQQLSCWSRLEACWDVETLVPIWWWGYGDGVLGRVWPVFIGVCVNVKTGDSAKR